MRKRDTAVTRASRRAGLLIAGVLLGVTLCAAVAYAGTAAVTVKRCGYVKAEYGNSGMYPWKMSCAEAKTVILGSEAKHAKVIYFSSGWDGGAVQIAGKYWVCTGQMGLYECGYPYRPHTVKGSHGYAGPFTQDVQWITCSPQSACARTTKFTQPTS
jgi:hypothetical protein